MKAQYILRRKSGNILAAHLDTLREANIRVVNIAHGLARIEGTREEINQFVKKHPDFTFSITSKREPSSSRQSLMLPFREAAGV